MKEVILTASVLILALILLRLLFRRTIPRRVQYALWGLVLVRLLIPVQLSAFSFPVIDKGIQVGQQVSAALERPVVLPQTSAVVQTTLPTQPVQAESHQTVQTEARTEFPDRSLPAGESQVPLPVRTVSPAQALDVVWKTGMLAMAAFFLIVNLRFRWQLCKNRVSFPVEGCPLPVYLCDRLSSPCLVGLFRPAIYLTPAAAQSGYLNYVLLHEYTHARHLDPLWALLRCLCLTIYWFHPLVWTASLLSRTDCELACDEGVLSALGQTQRLDYGRTLLALAPVAGRRANPLLTATTMASGKQQLKDRITRIAHRQRPVLAAVLATVGLAGLAGACAFSGGGAQVFPDGVFTLSAADLLPYTAPVFTPDPDAKQFSSSSYSGQAKSVNYGMVTYMAKDGSIYPTVSYNETGETMPWVMEDKLGIEDADSMPFLFCKQTDSGRGLQNTYQWFYYLDLFGTNGLITSYPGILPEQQEDWVYDFFAVDEEGNLSLLLRTYGSAGGRMLMRDLNGDGKQELMTDRQLFFQSDGTIYAVDYAGLLAERWPAFRTLEGAELTVGDSCILLTGTMEDDSGQTVSFLRTLTLEGEQLVVSEPSAGADGTVVLPLAELTVYEELNDPAPSTGVRPTRFGSNFGDAFSFGICSWEDGSCYPQISFDNDSVVPSFDRLDSGLVSDNMWLDDFTGLLGYEGLLVGWSEDSTLSNSPENWTIDLYRWNQAEGLVRFLRAESTFQGNVRVLDLDGDGDKELITDQQLFFRRDGTIYTVSYEDFLKVNWPAFRTLDTAAADPLEGCVVLAGTKADQNDQSAPFFGYLYLSENGLFFSENPIQ